MPKRLDTESITRRCCYAEGEWCPKDAEWEIITGPAPHDTVDACDDHVWQLCTDDSPITIWSLDSPLNFTLTRQEER